MKLIKKTTAIIIILVTIFSFGSNSISAYKDKNKFLDGTKTCTMYFDSTKTYSFIKNKTGYAFVGLYKMVNPLRIPEEFKGEKVTEARIDTSLEIACSDEVLESPKKVKVIISKNITKLSGTGTYRVKSFSVDKRNKVFSSKDGVLYSKDAKKLIMYPKGDNKRTEFTVPDTVEKIGKYALYSTRFKKLKLGKRVKDIGKGAFRSIEVEKKLKLPKSLKTIGDYAFCGLYQGHMGAAPLKIPSGVEHIGKYGVASYYKYGDKFAYWRDIVRVICKKNSVAHKFAVKHKLKFKTV